MWKPRFSSTILPIILVMFQCRYSLEPGSATRLARPLVRPCVYIHYRYNRVLYICICTYARRRARSRRRCFHSLHVWLRAWPLELYPEGRFISRNSLQYIISAPRNSKWCIHKSSHNQNIVNAFLSCTLCKYYSCRFIFVPCNSL